MNLARQSIGSALDRFRNQGHAHRLMGQEDSMADEHSGNDTSSSGSPVGDQQPEKIRKAASEAVSEASNLVRGGKEKAKSAAADAALTVTDISKKFLDRQLGTGATTVGHL